MKIRPATKADIPIIQKIANDTWPITYGKLLSAEQLDYMLKLMYSTEKLSAQMQAGHRFYIGETEKNIIGFACVYLPENTTRWKLDKLYVLPNLQTKGVGKSLLLHCENIAKENGASEIYLQVKRDNPAQNFYKKMGWVIESAFDFEIGDGYFMNDYIMVKKL